MKIGLALSGGGARGLAHLKILEAFDDLNIKPHIIAGTSIGAVIGALYASGLTSIEIQNFFKDLTFKRYAQLFDISFKGKGLIKGNKVKNLFSELLDNITFEELEIPLKVVATNLNQKKCKIFSKGDLGEAIRASISIPGIFEPVEINKIIYTDGGLTNLIPYDIIQNKCDIVIAIDVADETYNPTNQNKLINLISSNFAIVQTKLAYEKMKSNPPDYYIKINLKNVSMMDFHKSKTILIESKKYKTKMIKILKEILNQKA